MLEQILLDLRQNRILDVFVCYTHDLWDLSHHMMFIEDFENLVSLKGEVFLVFMQ